MLKGPLLKRGYDWWWHSLVAINRQTGERQPFFIEYFVINPALGGEEPILGQLAENKAVGKRPSYAMLKAGAWVPGRAAQIHNFYGINQFSAVSDPLKVQIGPHYVTETHLEGSVKLTDAEVQEHPEYMSEAGEMSWNLDAEKVLPYNVGFGASPLFRNLNAFEMFWHAQGMLTRYSGTIIYNGDIFDVTPETSAGYQDKNWGQDYTNLWIWLNCNNFTSRNTGEKLALTSLDVGGAEPVVWGKALPRRLLIAFYHEGQLYEFNFSKFWHGPKQVTNCRVEDDQVIWDIEAWNRKGKIKIDFSCPRSHMHLFNYENPDGEVRHRNLWNGGWASGTVELYRKVKGNYELVDVFKGDLGGCEFGEADPK
jgi:hypothetical protein